MIVLFFIFIVIPFILVGGIFFGFVFGVSALLRRIQDKKSGKTGFRTKEEKEKIVATQIICTAVLMFIAFITYLCIRYGVS